MAITKFAFTKDWTNSSDFKTVENDEAKVRADLQELHNETRDYINNTILASVDSAIADMQTWTKNAVAAATTGTLPDGSITTAKYANGSVTKEKLATGAIADILKTMTYGDITP
jgi:hypothetical protein